jgi:hypothetical protein
MDTGFQTPERALRMLKPRKAGGRSLDATIAEVVAKVKAHGFGRVEVFIQDHEVIVVQELLSHK